QDKQQTRSTTDTYGRSRRSSQETGRATVRERGEQKRLRQRKSRKKYEADDRLGRRLKGYQGRNRKDKKKRVASRAVQGKA
ncbi:hypothetical protein IscW_ISCW013408, partial [Ixodes scapularis]